MPADTEPAITTPSHLLRAAADRLTAQAADASPAPWVQSGRYDGEFFPSADGGHLRFADNTKITTYHDGRYGDGTLIATMRAILPAVIETLNEAALGAWEVEKKHGELAAWHQFATEVRLAGLVFGEHVEPPLASMFGPIPAVAP